MRDPAVRFTTCTRLLAYRLAAPRAPTIVKRCVELKQAFGDSLGVDLVVAAGQRVPGGLHAGTIEIRCIANRIGNPRQVRCHNGPVDHVNGMLVDMRLPQWIRIEANRHDELKRSGRVVARTVGTRSLSSGFAVEPSVPPRENLEYTLPHGRFRPTHGRFGSSSGCIGGGLP